MTSETTTATPRKKTSKAAAVVSGEEQNVTPKRKAASKVVETASETQAAEPAAPKRKRSVKAPAEAVPVGAENGVEIVAPKRKSSKTAKAAVVDEIPVHSEEERRQYIATLAYLRAESRGFAAGNELDDWLEAEADYHARFKTV